MQMDNAAVQQRYLYMLMHLNKHDKQIIMWKKTR